MQVHTVQIQSSPKVIPQTKPTYNTNYTTHYTPKPKALYIALTSQFPQTLSTQYTEPKTMQMDMCVYCA